MAQVLSFQVRPRASDWTQQEISEFYRVQSALSQAGVPLETDRGLTDENEPWFVFCRADTGEVFIHFARISGEYVIDGAGYGGVARGRDFQRLVRELLASEPFALSAKPQRKDNVFMHPAAILIALVGAAFFHTSPAKAGELAGKKAEPVKAQHPLAVLVRETDAPASSGLDPVQTSTLLAGVLIGLSEPLPPPLPTAPDASPSSFTLDSSIDVTSLKPVAADGPQSTHKVAEIDGHAPAIFGVAAHHAAESSILIIAPSTEGREAHIEIHASAPFDVPAVVALAPPVAPLAALDGIFLLAAASTEALPSDEAGDAVRGIGLRDHQSVRVAQTLPQALADAIQQGAHVPAAATSEGADGAGPPPLVTPPPIGGTAAADPPPPAAAAAPVAPAPAVALAAAHDAAINGAVHTFVSEVAGWNVVVSGRDLVIYDAAVFSDHSPLDAVTFTYSDGSAISLVGTTAELVYAHNLH